MGKKGSAGCSIEVGGVGVAPKHATMEFNEGSRTAVMHPNSDDPEKFKTFVNGEIVTEPTELKHGDRVLFGSHNYFIFVDPQVNVDENIEWEEAMKEVCKD